MTISGSNNTIYYNEFAGDSVRDDGFNNRWDDDESLGNYWNIGLSTGPYAIPGSASSIDRYPRTLLYIIQPDSFIMVEGSEGNVIQWGTFALYPDSYNIYCDVIENTSYVTYNEITNSEWDGNNVSLSLDDLAAGGYRFRLYIRDTYDLGAGSQVLVRVLEPPSEPTTGPTPVGIDWILVTMIFGGVAVTMVLIVIFVKLRR